MRAVEQPLVYLDSADWAYLEEGRAPGLEKELRHRAEAGELAFLLSHEHWVEVAGLGVGRERRLRFLCEFPGTYRLTAATDELLRFEARQLVALARGEQPSPVVLPLEELDAASYASVEPWVSEYGAVIRDNDRRVVSVKRYSRKIAPARDAKSVRRYNRKIGAFLRGVTDEVVRRLRADGELKGQIHEWILKRFVPRMGRTVKFLQRRWITYFPNLRFDPVFASTVIPCFPDEVRRDAELIGTIYEAWRRKENRKFAPALACAVALGERLEMQPDIELKESDLADARHAA